MIARIATLCQARSLARSFEGNIGFILKVLERVVEHEPDLICLPEAFTAKGVPTRTVADVAEALPSRTVETLAKLAREHRCYIICPIYTRRGETFRNSAILIGRNGEQIGIYDKASPCTSSPNYNVFEEGITPGDELGCFDLDFGRVGIQICMDVNFPDDWKQLAKRDVKAVFWPSAADGGMLLQTHAIMQHYYVISAVRTGKARIINPCGRIIAETQCNETYLIADINLDFVVARQEFNTSIPDYVKQHYGSRVSINIYQDEGLFLIEPLDNQITTAQLQAEFGFETASQYINRHLVAYEQFRKGLCPKTQVALHGNRRCY